MRCTVYEMYLFLFSVKNIIAALLIRSFKNYNTLIFTSASKMQSSSICSKSYVMISSSNSQRPAVILLPCTCLIWFPIRNFFCTELIEMSESELMEHCGDCQMNQTIWWSSWTPRCSLLWDAFASPPPSNQRCWLSADVIIINLFRQASDDWWEAHPNQWRMHDKCLLWRLWQPRVRWSGFFPPHYTTNPARANNSATLRADL